MAGRNITHLCLHVQCQFMLDYNQSGISRNIFIRVSNIKFHVKSISGRFVDTCRWMDGRTDNSKSIGGFTGFVNAPVSQTSLFLLFPSFHALSANMFKIIPHILSPVAPSRKFPHSSAGYQLDVYARAS
jgi:hypothetical protein